MVAEFPEHRAELRHPEDAALPEPRDGQHQETAGHPTEPRPGLQGPAGLSPQHLRRSDQHTELHTHICSSIWFIELHLNHLSE